MALAVGTDDLPSSESAFDSVINWILSHGDVVAAGIVAIVVVAIAVALGGAVQSVLGKFTLPVGLLLMVVIFAGYKATMG